MNEIVENVSLKKLPVWATIREAFGFAWGYRRVLWGWIILGAFLTGFGDLVAVYELMDKDDGLMALFFNSIDFLAQISSLFVLALLAVYCHRIFLISPREVLNKFPFFTRRELKYFEWMFRIGSSLCLVLLIFPGIILAAIFWYPISDMFAEGSWEKTFIGWALVYGGFLLPFWYLFGRGILVFPTIALDQTPSPAWSWEKTKRNAWRIFVLVGFIPLTVGNLGDLLLFLGLSGFPLFSAFLTPFVLFLFTPVEVAVISIAFRELTNWTPPSQLRQST